MNTFGMHLDSFIISYRFSFPCRISLCCALIESTRFVSVLNSISFINLFHFRCDFDKNQNRNGRISSYLAQANLSSGKFYRSSLNDKQTGYLLFLSHPQTLLSLAASMSFFCIGLVRGYSSPAIPSIHENDPNLLPTKDIASWASNGNLLAPIDFSDEMQSLFI